MGFWTGDDAATFYGLAAQESSGPVRAPAQDTVSLTPGGAPGTVTLLLDPRGPVHATTGVLPVKSIDIPPVHYAGTLAGLVPTLAAHPLLSGSASGAPALTLPKVSAGSWSWITVGTGAWVSAPAAEARSDATLDYTPQQAVEGWLRPVSDKETDR